ncbi:MAG: bifunctional 5,10-methylenetetrahydrofolate dehydrogenase/5,10-methenyltetrahydrofolate cyclohydrolase [Planctomycetota bacterium]
MAEIIDGKAIARAIKAEVAARLQERGGAAPLIVAVEVGQDDASASYVRNQARQADRVGILHRLDRLPDDIDDAGLQAHLRRLGEDPEVTAIMLQTPLPRHLDLRAARAAIDPEKDVEAVTTTNAGRLVSGVHRVAPCTALAAVACLEAATGGDLRGLHVTVIGRSEIVGRPLALLLLHGDATVTVTHRHTRHLAQHTREADVVISAVGQPGLVTADMVREGAIVVDVGTNWIAEQNRLVGDVDYEAVAAKASRITPVPGGVGPVTVAMLLRNAVHLLDG